MTNAWPCWEKSKATGMCSLPVKTGWILASEVSLKSKFNCAAHKTQHISYEFKKNKVEPAIIWKLVTCQRITSKRYSTSMGQHLSPRYGQVILVSRYPVLTAVNWSQHWCAICAQYQSSCAPTLARKCDIEHCFCCGADGRAVYCHVITKFSGMGRFTYPWCSRQSSAIKNAVCIIALQQQQHFISFLLYRHECFTGKYTTRKIHKNYIRTRVVYFP